VETAVGGWVWIAFCVSPDMAFITRNLLVQTGEGKRRTGMAKP